MVTTKRVYTCDRCLAQSDTIQGRWDLPDGWHKYASWDALSGDAAHVCPDCAREVREIRDQWLERTHQIRIEKDRQRAVIDALYRRKIRTLNRDRPMPPHPDWRHPSLRDDEG